MTTIKSNLVIGIDVGSTTVKCVVVDTETLSIEWSKYERHETRQAEKLYELLEEIETAFPAITANQSRAFITGSGAGPIAKIIGARFVQEVNAVTLAVEQRHPDVNSVVELGGQDAKIIIFKPNPETGNRKVITSMNDKCASGTGATIDKCITKVGMPKDQISSLHFDSEKLHHVAAKCGVFAETDIVNLIKSGVPANEVLNSLADAIVMQNLSVLTRGNTLLSKVLLLGGPNTYLPFLQECWRMRIPETWEQRGHAIGELSPEQAIIIPDNAQYYAAFGAVIFGMEESDDEVCYQGMQALQDFIKNGRKAKLGESAGPALLRATENLTTFRDSYQVPLFNNAVFEPGTTVEAFIGIDGGSTSSKAVLMNADGDLLCKQYQLSKGNPIQDVIELLSALREYVRDQQCSLKILGCGATGYAADVLEKATKCDVNIVETVAHMMSAKHYCGEDIDVICDIGGQDIKVLFMQHGTIKNFRLSNQCSAGNGMLLQAMADQFGVDVRDFADVAFTAQLSPKFSYGCAVFLDTDRVNFQKEGFSREELFAGLAMVLPKNVWQYVVQIPRMSELGRSFVLQGGTQYNLAAVKAQVDYIKERVPNAQVMVHPHCGEAGAIGAALEAKRIVERRGHSTFIGLDETISLTYTSRTDESTRCTFCENNCSRTFIDTRTLDNEVTRYIAGFSCEKGTVESKEAVITLNKERKRLKSKYPNLVDYEANFIFRHIYKPALIPEAGTVKYDDQVKRTWFGMGPVRHTTIMRAFGRSAESALQKRKKMRIGIPRVLNVNTLGPFMRTYLETLGLEPRNVVFSDQTSEELWLEGGKYGSIDPCFPAKVSLAHVHHLIQRKHRRKPLDYIWFPCITNMPTFVSHTMGSTTCPIVSGTPKVANAAFTKESNFFEQAGIEYVDQALNFDAPALLIRQLYETWHERLDISEDENKWACEQGWRAMQTCDAELQKRGLELLTEAEQNNDVILLLLGRPYHNDPGLNHEILEEFQSLGYPVLSIRSIPKDPSYLQRFFQPELDAGKIRDVFDVCDVWPENYSVNSVQKVWAAKFAARHPNVAVLDISSFKCGHDAPTYGIIDQIMATSQTPFMAMHDLDANKPGGSIKIRVKTYAYTLQLYKEHLIDSAKQRGDLEQAVAAKRLELMSQHLQQIDKRAQQQDPQTWAAMNSVYEDYLNQEQAEHSERAIPKDVTIQKPNSVKVNFSNNVLKKRDELIVRQAQSMREAAMQCEQGE